MMNTNSPTKVLTNVHNTTNVNEQRIFLSTYDKNKHKQPNNTFNVNIKVIIAIEFEGMLKFKILPNIDSYLVHRKLSFTSMYQKNIIVGIGPILNKELKIIFRSDCSDQLGISTKLG